MDVKQEVFKELGEKCGKCGFDYSTAPLTVVSSGGERRSQKVQYAAWMMAAYISGLKGLGDYALWCENCLAIKAAEDTERARELEANGPPRVVKVGVPVAFWKTSNPKETQLSTRSRWVERNIEMEIEGFVMVEGGEIYAYDPKVKWEKAVPVAADWAAFAAERGLEEAEPAEGTTVVKVRGGKE